MKTGKEKIETMTDYHFSRWASLLDAVNIIADKADDRKIPWNKVDIKPKSCQDYIEAMCDSYALLRKRDREERLAKSAVKLASIFYNDKTDKSTVHNS